MYIYIPRVLRFRILTILILGFHDIFYNSCIRYAVRTVKSMNDVESPCLQHSTLYNLGNCPSNDLSPCVPWIFSYSTSTLSVTTVSTEASVLLVNMPFQSEVKK